MHLSRKRSLVESFFLQHEAHEFIIDDFRLPTVCHVCHNVLFGVIQQGFACRRMCITGDDRIITDG